MSHCESGELEALFHGALGNEDERRVLSHLEACARCADLADDVWETVRPGGEREAAADYPLPDEKRPALEAATLRRIHRASLARDAMRLLVLGFLTVAGALLAAMAIGAIEEDEDDD